MTQSFGSMSTAMWFLCLFWYSAFGNDEKDDKQCNSGQCDNGMATSSLIQTNLETSIEHQTPPPATVIAGYQHKGTGYCDTGYYAGWNSADATSVDVCANKCNAEPQCMAFSLYQGKTCSRYNSDVCRLLSDRKDANEHISYVKEKKWVVPLRRLEATSETTKSRLTDLEATSKTTKSRLTALEAQSATTATSAGSSATTATTATLETAICAMFAWDEFEQKQRGVTNSENEALRWLRVTGKLMCPEKAYPWKR